MAHARSDVTAVPDGTANSSGHAGALRFDHDHIRTHDEASAAGRAARGDVPRKAHAEFRPRKDRDPMRILAEQNAMRVPELVPLRMKRMLQNPFTFYRGTAALQAADLADEPTTGANVTICGDAHLANFGLFSSPQRTMVFDLNDFDESAYGPWEWDVKRFVTSVVIAAQHKGFNTDKTETAALEAAASYRIGLRQMVDLPVLERYYLRGDVKRGSPNLHHTSQAVVDRALKAAEKRTSERVIQKITRRADDGTMFIAEDAPTLTHLPGADELAIENIVNEYRATLSPDISLLLSQYTATDVVRRVVGVGSVGTRCFLVVFTGPRAEPLVLQVKEAHHSVLTEFGGAAPVPPTVHRPSDEHLHGYRVVGNQRILQAVSDPFLGYIDVGDRSYYVRQFRDRNVSLDLDTLGRRPFNDYVNACGTSLARGHAQSPNAPFIAGYLGPATTFDDSVVQWAMSYAQQSLKDFTALRRSSLAAH
jgi:uncharacterized protein (DUF2252 family)